MQLHLCVNYNTKPITVRPLQQHSGCVDSATTKAMPSSSIPYSAQLFPHRGYKLASALSILPISTPGRLSPAACQVGIQHILRGRLIRSGRADVSHTARPIYRGLSLIHIGRIAFPHDHALGQQAHALERNGPARAGLQGQSAAAIKNPCP